MNIKLNNDASPSTPVIAAAIAVLVLENIRDLQSATELSMEIAKLLMEEGYTEEVHGHLSVRGAGALSECYRSVLDSTQISKSHTA